MIQSFNVTIPADGSTTNVQNEASEQPQPDQASHEKFSQYPAQIWLRNTGTPDILVGGPTPGAPYTDSPSPPSLPLKSTDPILGPIAIGPNDQLIANIAGALKATLNTGTTGANNAITWTAQTAGAAGNSITIRLQDPGGNNQPLTVNVTTTNIVVLLATDGGGLITSTAAQVEAAILASAPASALVTATNQAPSTGAGLVVATGPTNLASGAGVAGQLSVLKVVQ